MKKINPVELDKMRHKKAIEELHHFMDTASEAEKDVVGHLKINIGVEAFVREIRRLLGESSTKCKVIPFPLERVRKIAKNERKSVGNTEPVIFELQRGI